MQGALVDACPNVVEHACIWKVGISYNLLCVHIDLTSAWIERDSVTVHHICILFCLTILWALSVASACMRIIVKLRQQRGLKVDVISQMDHPWWMWSSVRWTTPGVWTTPVNWTCPKRGARLHSAKTIRFVGWGNFLFFVYTFWGLLNSLYLLQQVNN